MVGVYVPRRWILAILAHFGFVFVYAIRVNMSIIIVAMVNNTGIDRPLSNQSGCKPRENGGTKLLVSFKIYSYPLSLLLCYICFGSRKGFGNCRFVVIKCSRLSSVYAKVVVCRA